MTYKTVARNLSGKAIIYVGPGGKDYPFGNDMVVVRFEDREFKLRAGYWVSLQPWRGPFGVVEETGSLVRNERNVPNFRDASSKTERKHPLLEIV